MKAWPDPIGGAQKASAVITHPDEKSAVIAAQRGEGRPPKHRPMPLTLGLPPHGGGCKDTRPPRGRAAAPFYGFTDRASPAAACHGRGRKGASFFQHFGQSALHRLVPVLALLMALALQLAPARAQSGLEAALDATLVIYTDDLDEAFLGSGFLYGDGSIAVTNQHVVGAARSVELRSLDGRRLSAPVIARDASRDIALIAVEGAVLGKGLSPAKAAPAVGTPVFALGAPLGEEFTATRGMISAIGRQISEAAPIRYLQHDAAVNPGSSGGPLVDAEGQLVGMNSAIADGSRLFVGIGYAMTVTDIERLSGLMLAGELRDVPKLGLRLRPISRKIAMALGLTEGEGLLVDAVVEGGIAERGGLRPGDVLLAFGDRRLATPGDLAFQIEQRITDRPELLILRGGLRFRLVLNLAAPREFLAKMTTGPGPARVESYSFSGLGIALGEGQMVTGLNPGSPAAYAGLAAEDVILSVNGAPAASLDLAAFRIEGPLVLLVRRGEVTLHVIIDPWSKGRAARPIGGSNVLDPEVVIF